nr:MAG TPA: hypothetical protein [Caudoviricetes sp.]
MMISLLTLYRYRGNKNEMDTRRHNGSWLYCKFVYIRI